MPNKQPNATPSAAPVNLVSRKAVESRTSRATAGGRIPQDWATLSMMLPNKTPEVSLHSCPTAAAVNVASRKVTPMVESMNSPARIIII